MKKQEILSQYNYLRKVKRMIRNTYVLIFIAISLLFMISPNRSTAQDLWGMTYIGGTNNLGVIFEYNVSTNTYTNKVDFTGTSGSYQGANPNGSLFLANDGNLYGLTSAGGANNLGVMFKYVISTNTYSKLFDFTGTSGSYPGAAPKGNLIQASDGILYGVTTAGGANNIGVIFKYDLSNSTYTKLLDFTGSVGPYYGNVGDIGLFQANDGNMYGMTAYGGSSNLGVFYKYTLDGRYTKLLDLTGSSNGNLPYQTFIQPSDNNLYGTTCLGGTNSNGILFKYTLQGTFTKLYNFVNTSAYRPTCALTQASDGNLYGMAPFYTTTGNGAIFKYSSGGTYTNMFTFSGTNGKYPYGNFIQASDGNMYGMTYIGGTSNLGVLFQYAPGGSTITVKFNFTGTTGSYRGASPIYGNLIEVCSNPPTITGNSIVCAGSTGNVYSTSDGMSNYTWVVSSGGTIEGSSTSNTVTVTWNTGGVQTVSVNYLRTSTGCAAKTPIVYNVTVNPYVSVETNPVCYNSSPGNLTANISGGNGNYTYQWYTAPSTEISGATNSIYSPGNLTYTSTYYCVVTSEECGTSTTNNAVITVNGNFSTGSIGNAQTICYNAVPSALTFTSAPSGGAGYYYYQWYKTPSTIITGATNSTYTSTALTATTTFYCVVSSGSCGTGTTNNVTVTVYPNLTGGTVGSAQSICYNTAPAQIRYTTLPTGGSGTYTYQWYKPPTTAVSGATSTAYTPPTLSVTTTYYCKVTSSGCAASSNNIIMTVYSNLGANISGGTSPICYNTSPGTFTATGTGGTGSYTYQWYTTPSNIVSGATSSTYNPGNITGTTGYYCLVTSGSCGTATTATTTITVYENLSANISGGTSPICYNTSPGTFTATGTGGTGSYTYQWYTTPSNIVSGATNSTYNPGNITGTTGYYCLVTSGSCGTATTATTTITVNVSPSISQEPVPLEKCQTLSADFNVSATGTAPLSYIWYKNDSPINDATQSTFSIASVNISDAGNYSCIISNACGNVTSSSVTLTVNVPPTITEQPISGVQCVGTAKTFSITASSNLTITYQWMKDGNPIDGADTETLFLSSTNDSDIGNYSCNVINLCGTTTSNTYSLTKCCYIVH